MNELTQNAALEALENEAKKNIQVKEIIAEREKMAEILRGLPIVEKVYPSNANFLLVKMKDGNKTYNYLLTFL